jgi:hypothetical protein
LRRASRPIAGAPNRLSFAFAPVFATDWISAAPSFGAAPPFGLAEYLEQTGPGTGGLGVSTFVGVVEVGVHRAYRRSGLTLDGRSGQLQIRRFARTAGLTAEALIHEISEKRSAIQNTAAVRLMLRSWHY